MTTARIAARALFDFVIKITPRQFALYTALTSCFLRYRRSNNNKNNQGRGVCSFQCALFMSIIDAVGVDSRNKRTRYLTKQKIAFQRALESRHQPTNTCEKRACKAHYPPLLVVKQSATTKRAGASGNKSERGGMKTEKERSRGCLAFKFQVLSLI
jgi:hypothetical protein